MKMIESEEEFEIIQRKENLVDEIYIQNEIDKLNIDELIKPKQNHALKKVIQTDRDIVMNLDDKISKLQKSCQYGKQVSKIINFKAESLSTISLKDKLKLILDTFVDMFSECRETNTEFQLNDDDNSFIHNNNIVKPTISFIKISKYFSINTLPFCSLNYDTIPLNLFISDENNFTIETNKKKNYNRTKQSNNNYKKLKDYTYDNEPEVKLETYEQSMKLKYKLNQLEKIQKNVKFFNFIIDCDPINGFNETTFRLFLFTLLVSKGHVEFYKNTDGILCIKSCETLDPNNENDGDFTHNYSHALEGELKKKKKKQALLTSWSYNKWEQLVNQINKES
ncbi:conserved Plasmodium protein, unknown function [Plasmodium berghei]|nr:conserved Plasmodium protein, unknown function [Plasmodium berghei]